MSEVKEVSTERQNLLIKTIVIVVLLLLSLLATILYVYAYPKTHITMYDGDQLLKEYSVKKHTTLGNVSGYEKVGYTFREWTYDYDGLHSIEPDRELVEDELDLYAQYNVNTYTITYHVRVWNDVQQQWEYSQTVCPSVQVDYYDYFTLPDGKGVNGELLPEFTAVKGHTFVGWSTENVTDATEPTAEVWRPGTRQRLGTAGNLDVYAYFQANRYTVQLYSGIQYYTDYESKTDNMILDPVTDSSATPAKDNNGDFIIRNSRLSGTNSLVRYTNNISTAIEGISPTLTAEDTFNDEGDSYLEYSFGGWYLDFDLTKSVADYDMKVAVDDNDIPYLTMNDDNGNVLTVYSELDPEDGVYKFRLYSKWTRNSYKLNFNKRMSGSSGYIPSITVYKYDDTYGKYYNTTVFDEDSRKNNNYYNTLDLSNPYITTDAFKSSLRGWRFTGWTTYADADNVEGNVWYNAWKQDDNKDITLTKSGTNEWTGIGTFRYINTTYVHTVSEDVTLYAQWAQLNYLTLLDSMNSVKKVKIEAISGEVLTLPNESVVVDTLGWSKKYNSFNGWTTRPNYASAKTYPAGYEYQMGENSLSLYVNWEKDKYTVNFFYNNGTEDSIPYTVAGGATVVVPQAPARSGYIFEGWTKKQYAVDTKVSEIQANEVIYKNVSGSKYTMVTVTGNASYYAVWTTDYIVKFDANGGRGTVPNTSKYSTNTSSKNLTMSVSLSGSNLVKEGYNLKGWALVDSEGNIYTGENNEYVYKSSVTLVFDFSTAKATGSGKYNILNSSSDSRDFYLSASEEGEDSTKNVVTLYAVWEAMPITITLLDKQTTNSVSATAYYGQPFDLSAYKDHKTFSKVGYELVGWGNKSGTKLYDAEGENAIIPAELIKPGSPYIFYAIYQERSITVNYRLTRFDNTEIELYGNTAGGGTYGVVQYGSQFIEPSPAPTAREYGNDAYIFNGWYYLDGEEKVYIKNNDVINYDVEGKLTLWAEFIIQTYVVKFTVISPLTGNVIETVERTVEKGTSASLIYDEIKAEINRIVTSALESNSELKAYTLNDLVYSYENNSVSFGSAIIWNETRFTNVSQTGNIITFRSAWKANSVKFVYTYDNGTDIQKITDKHTGYTYSDSKELVLITHEQAVASGFTLDSGIRIRQWKIGLGENALTLATGTKLIGVIATGARFSAVSGLSAYIDWQINDTQTSEYGSVYEGTITLVAKTTQIFTIYYHKFNGSNAEIINTTQVEYLASNPYLVLMNGDLVVEGSDLRFNGWRIGNEKGTLYSKDTNYQLDPETTTDFVLHFYADMSFAINYVGEGATINGENSYTEWINCYNNGYVTSLDLSTLPNVSLKDGYTKLYVIYGEQKYRAENNGQWVATDFSIDYTGQSHTITIMGAYDINIVYTVNKAEDEAIVGQDSEILSDSYTVLADGSSVVEMKIAYSATKKACEFQGWSVEGSDNLYQLGDTVNFTKSVTLVAKFSEPQEGQIAVTIEYVYEEKTAEELDRGEMEITATHTAHNGEKYMLKSMSDLPSFAKKNYTIKGWKHDNTEYILSDSATNYFDIPTIVEEGEVYRFVAIWEAQYTVEFDVAYTGVDKNPEAKKLVTGEALDITASMTPHLIDTTSTIFSYWRLGYYTVDNLGLRTFVELKDNNDNAIVINEKDTIVFGSSFAQMAREDSYKYTIAPVKGVFEYTLLAKWKAEQFDITIMISKDGTASEDTSNICSYTFKVDYGFALTTEYILEQDTCGDSHNIANKAIKGWSIRGFNSSPVNDSGMAEITKSYTLYSIWETEYQFAYAEETDEFGYKTEVPEAECYFDKDEISFSAQVVKSIYFKGKTTIYLNDGTFQVVDGTSTEYYRVKGFKITTGATVYKDLVAIDSTFSATTSDMVATPVFEQMFKVEFIKNTSENEEVYTALTTYLCGGDTLELKDIKVSRGSDYEFVGWGKFSDSTEKEETIANITANTKLFAIWNCNMSASFRINDKVIFSIKYDNKGTITKSALQSKLSESSQGLKPLRLNGNTMTFEYSDNKYYLHGFRYGQTVYTLDELTALTFTANVDISLDMIDIYTITYSAGCVEGDNTRLDYEYLEYIVENASSATGYSKIVSTGLDNKMVLPELPSDIGSYDNNEMTGWKWISATETYIWSSSSSMSFTRDQLTQMIAKATSRKIAIEINWEGKSYGLYLAYVNNENLAVDPYDMYSGFSADGSDFSISTGWTNAYDTVYNYSSTGTLSSIAGTEEKVVVRFGKNIVFGSKFINSSRYTLIGWSTTPYALGLIPSDYYKVSDITSSDNINHYAVNSTMLGNADKNGIVTLYPVYQLVAVQGVTITANNGSVKYSIVSGEATKGFVKDNHAKSEASIISGEKAEVEVTFLNNIVVTATEGKNKDYTFSNMILDGDPDKKYETSSISVGLDAFASNVASHTIAVNFASLRLTISISYSYEYELNSSKGDDTSTLRFNTVELNNGSRTATGVEVDATTNIVTQFALSKYYEVKSITSGKNAISLESGVINTSSLDYDDATKTASLVILLTPVTGTMSFDASGAILPSTINVKSNNIYDGIASGTVAIEQNSAKVIMGSTVELPMATLEKNEFIGWNYFGQIYSAGVDFEITDNSTYNLTAIFEQNVYIVTYVYDKKKLDVEFTGGSLVKIGYNGDTAIDTAIAGKTFNGWKVTSGRDQLGQVFQTDDETTLQKNNYTLTAQYTGANVTLIYANVDTEGNRVSGEEISVTLEFGADFTIYSLSDIGVAFWTIPSGYYLYGWSTTANTIKAGEYISFDKISETYLCDTYYVEAVYYKAYTYTFTYDLSFTEGGGSSTTVIPSEKVTVYADKDGNIDESYTISDTEPNNTAEYFFDGYKVYFDSETTGIQSDKIFARGRSFNLQKPTTGHTATYTIKAQWTSAKVHANVTIQIADPRDTTTYLTMNFVDGSTPPSADRMVTEIESVGTNFPITSELIPVNKGNEWSIGGERVFTTTSDIAYDMYVLQSYTIKYRKTADSELEDGGILALDGGYHELSNTYYEFVLIANWGYKVAVNYYDVDGNKMESISEYCVSGTLYKVVDDDNYNVSCEGYVLVGLIESDEVLSSKDEVLSLMANNPKYITFGSNISINKETYLYPALSRIYTVILNPSFDTLEANGGDRNNVSIGGITYGNDGFEATKTVNLYYSNDSETYKISDIFGIYSPVYTRQGMYSFEGFTLISGKMAYELGEPCITSYTLDKADADENGNINIYTAWERQTYRITFQLNAKNNNGKVVYSGAKTEVYYYNASVDLTYNIVDGEYVFGTDAINSLVSTVKGYRFTNFSLDSSNIRDITEYTVLSGATIYINFEGQYTIKFIDTLTGINDTVTFEGSTYTHGDLIGRAINKADHQLPSDAAGKKANMWYLDNYREDSEIVVKNFFESDTHIITSADLASADENYTIYVVIEWIIRAYTVNLHYYATTSSMLTGYYDGVASVETFQSGDYLFSEGTNGTITSKFDNLITINGSKMTLNDIAEVFHNVAGEFNAWQGMVKIGSADSKNEIEISRYIVDDIYATNPVEDVYTSDIYVVYGETDFYISVQSFGREGDKVWTLDNGVDYTLNEDKYEDVKRIELKYTDELTLGAQVEDGYIFKSYAIYDIANKTLLYDADAVNAVKDYANLAIDASGNVTITNIAEDIYGSMSDSTGYILAVVYEPKYVEITLKITVDNNLVDTVNPYVVIGNTILDWSKLQSENIYDADSNMLIARDYTTSKATNSDTGKVERAIVFKTLYGSWFVMDNESENVTYLINSIHTNNEILDSLSRYISTDSSDGFGNPDAGIKDMGTKYTLEINVDYSLNNQTVYISTYSPDGNYYTGTPRSITYTIGGETCSVNTVAESYRTGDTFYNLQAEIPYGATLSSGFATTSLSGFEFVKWTVNTITYSEEGDGVITNSDFGDGLVVSGETYIVAVFTAKELSINFKMGSTIISDLTITNADTEKFIDNDGNGYISLGDDILLPYAYIIDETTLSYGWNVGDFGEYYTLRSQSYLSGTRYVISAEVSDIYYVTYHNDSTADTVFEITSEFTQTPSIYSIITTGYGDDIFLLNGKTYYVINNGSITTSGTLSLEDDTCIVTDSIVVPDTTLSVVSGTGKFKGWKSKNNYVYENYYYFDLQDVNGTTHEIYLSTIVSHETDVSFYIKDQDGNNLKINTGLGNSENYNKDCFTISVVQGTNLDMVIVPSAYNFVRADGSTANTTKWSAYTIYDLERTDPIYQFFTAGDLTSDYEFHGWTVTASNSKTYTDIISQYSSLQDNSALYYTFTNGIRSKNTSGANDMNALINDKTNPKTDYYPIWETKNIVKMASDTEEDGKDYSSEVKYATGTQINLTQGDFGSFVMSGKKWIGWEIIVGCTFGPNGSVSGGTKYAYIFDSAACPSEYGISDRNVKNNISYYTMGKESVYMTPLWSKGVMIYLNVNFDSARSYYANVMKTYNSNAESVILSKTGIPQLNDDEYSYIYEDFSTQAIDGTQYTTVYRLTTLDGDAYFSAGNEVSFAEWINTSYNDVTDWTLAFTHNYFTTGTTWSYDKNYFNFAGLYYYKNNIKSNNDSDKIYILKYGEDYNTLEITNDILGMSGQRVDLYIDWTPAIMEVKFYQQNASSVSDGSITTYSYQVEKTDENGTYYENYDYVLYVPFGQAISSVSTTDSDKVYFYSGKNGEHQGNLEDLQTVAKYGYTGDPRYFRLNRWSDMDNHLVADNNNPEDTHIYKFGSYSDPVVGTVRLYPIFDTAYHVNFVVGKTFSELLESDQFVVPDEQILIKTPLTSPVDYSKRIKTIETGSTIIKSETASIPNSVLYDQTIEQTGQELYIRIYFNLEISTYIPVYNGTGASETASALELKTISLNLNQTYSISSLFEEGDDDEEYFATPDMSDYGNATFAGWYISNITNYYSSDKAYMMGAYHDSGYSEYILKLSEISRFTLTQNGAKIDVTFNYHDGSMVKVTMGDQIAVYAKIYNTNEVAVATTASNYAYLTLARVTDEGGYEYGYINSDYFTFNTGTLSSYVSGCYSRINYTTVYNSSYTPVINLVTNNGYNLSKVSVYNNYDNFINNNYAQATVTPDFWTKSEGECVDTSNSNFTLAITRTTEYPDADIAYINSYTKINNTINIKNMKNVDTNIFVLHIKYLSYDISYTVDNSKGFLEYYDGFTTNADGSSKSLSFNSGSITIELGTTVHSEGTNASRMSLSYESKTSGNTQTLTIKGVPYGTNLQVFARMNGYNLGADPEKNYDYWYHFESWNPNPTNIGLLDTATQRITPSDSGSNNTFITSYIITTNIVANSVDTINLNVMYNKTSTNTEEMSTWEYLWSKLSEPGSKLSIRTDVVDNSGKTNYSTQALSLSKTGNPSIFASDSKSTIVGSSKITNLLSEANKIYNEAYNNGIASTDGVTSVNGLSLEQLLNYFWFDGVWESLYTDRDNYILQDGRIYVKDKQTSVELYCELSDAIIAYFGQEIIDYIDSNATIQNINRATITSLSVTNSYTNDGKVGYYALMKDGDAFVSIYGNNGAIKSGITAMYLKAPSRSVVEMKYTPMGASSRYNTYHLQSYRDNPSSNVLGYSLDDMTVTLNKQSYSPSDMQGMFMQLSAGASVEKVPELKLQAQFQIDTHTVTFYSESGKKIESADIEIGYDLDVYDACMGDRELLAERYNCTLESLRKADRLPLFAIDTLVKDLDRSSKLVKFRHSEDNLVEDIAYGNFSHIFDKWTGVADINTPIKVSTSLTATYVTNTTTGKTLNKFYVTYAYASGVLATTYTRTFYLAKTDFTDSFGNEYVNQLSELILTDGNGEVIGTNLNQSIYEDNQFFDRDNSKFYLVSLDKDGFVAGASYATTSENDKYYSVPVTYTILCNRKGIAYTSDNVSFTTIGGAFTLTTDKSTANLIIGGVMLIGDEIYTTTTHRLKQGSFVDYQFGLWELTLTYPQSNSSNTQEMELCARTDCDKGCKTHQVFAGAEVSANAVFNGALKISKDQLDRGDLYLLKPGETIATGTKIGDEEVSIFIPSTDASNGSSGVRVSTANNSHDAHYSIVAMGKGTDGNYTAKIVQDYQEGNADSGTLIYTLVFVPNTADLKTVKWSISYVANSATYNVAVADKGNYYDLLDSRGVHSMLPISIQSDIKFVFNNGYNETIGGVITNISDGGQTYLQSFMGTSNQVFKVVANANNILLEGTQLEIKYTNNKYQIYNKETGAGDYGYIETNVKNGNISNVRLQYQNIKGAWVDFGEGTFAQPSTKTKNADGTRDMYIRIACEWTTIDVTFETLYNHITTTGVTSYTNGSQSISISDAEKNEIATKKGSVKWDNTAKSETGSSVTVSVLKGSTISFAGNQFTIKSPTYSGNNPIDPNNIIVTATVGTNATLTGWLKVKSGNDVVEKVNSTYTNISEMKFIAWIEPTQNLNIAVNQNQVTINGNEVQVPGYGKVTVTRKTAVEVLTGASETKTEYDYWKDNIDGAKGNTGYYAQYSGVGITNRFAIKFEASTVGHTFMGATYNSGNNTANGNISTSSAYSLGTTINVSYDAINTKSDISVYDYNNTIVSSTSNKKLGEENLIIYGGYTYKIKENATGSKENYTYTLTITDFWKNSTSYTYKLKTNTILKNLYRSEYDTSKDRNEKGADDIYTSNTEITVKDNKVGKYVAFSIIEKVYQITLNITVVNTDKNGTVTTLTDSSDNWGNKLSITQSNGASVSSNTITLTINYNTERFNLSLHHNKGLGYGGVLFNYKEESINTIGTDTYDYIFKPLNEYMIQSVSISDKHTRTITAEYQTKTNTADKVEESQILRDRDGKITYTEYDVTVNMVERTDITVSFGLSLPYFTDYRNIELNSYTYTEQYKINKSDSNNKILVNGYDGINSKGNISNDASVYSSSVSTDSQGNKYLPTNFKVTPNSTLKLTKNNDIWTLAITTKGSTSNSLEILKFKDTGIYNFKGVYTIQGSTAHYLTMDDVSFSGSVSSYKMWGANEAKDLKSGNGSTIEIKGDTRIMLYFERKAINITIDYDIWTKNYKDIYNKLNQNSIFNSKSSSATTYTYPSGLVGIAPLSYAESDNFYATSNYPSWGDNTNSTQTNAMIPLTSASSSGPLDIWKSGIKLSYEDSDLYTRMAKLTGNMSGSATFTKFATQTTANNSFKIVGRASSGTSTVDYNVELQGATDWLIMALPYGDSCYEKAHYAKVKFYTSPTGEGYFNTLEGIDSDGYVNTLSSKSFTLISTSYIAPTNSDTVSYTMQVSKQRDSRLTEGMTVNSSLSTAYGTGSTSLNYSYTITRDSGIARDRYRAYISGYTVTYYSANGTSKSVTYSSSYFDPEDIDKQSYSINISKLPETNTPAVKVDIRPIWEQVRVYSVTFSNRSTIYKGNNTQTKESRIYKSFSSFDNKNVIAGSTYTFLYNDSDVSSQPFAYATTSTGNSYTNIYTISRGNAYLWYFQLDTTINGSNTRNVFSAIYSGTSTLSVSNASGTYANTSSSGISFTLSNVQSDIVITPCWMSMGRTFTYKHSGTIKNELGSYSITKKTASLTTTTKTFAYAPNYNFGVMYMFNALEGYTYGSSTHPAEYFKIYQAKNSPFLKTVESGGGSSSVSFAITHYAHKTNSSSDTSTCRKVYTSFCEYCTCSVETVTWQHTYNSTTNDKYTKIDGSYHTHLFICDAKNCPDPDQENKTEKQGHGNWKNITNATCIKDGSQTCGDCGYVQTLAKLGHSMSSTVNGATCQDYGYKYCTRKNCNHKEYNTTKGPHNFTKQTYRVNYYNYTTDYNKQKYCGQYKYQCKYCSSLSGSYGSSTSINSTWNGSNGHSWKWILNIRQKITKPDPAHCWAIIEFDRKLCSKCGYICMEDDPSITSSQAHSCDGIHPFKRHGDCKYCGLYVNTNDYDAVSDDYNWSTTMVTVTQLSWTVSGDTIYFKESQTTYPYLMYYRIAYSYVDFWDEEVTYVSSNVGWVYNDCPFSGMSTGLWYSTLRGLESYDQYIDLYFTWGNEFKKMYCWFYTDTNHVYYTKMDYIRDAV